ncbi:3-keto-disaccharide hydrolase [Pelagicoccus mobilis]|uniref:DUF1080 domain-containing protein n=1 Tax=Pelagicoccus mobilis TaxID=415221 RepID=A0A934RWT0_9BACT|nr:DUF1080 domain-containing protein [Pelagicoccus mobilis]MBK1875832.1 DUF1080 domain-containing protein [Pelagicoccus mobilis]
MFNAKRLSGFAVIALMPLGLQAQDLPEIDWKELGKTQPWLQTEFQKDIPVVTPGTQGSAPSDAIVLFDGTDLSKWEKTPFGEGVRMDRTEIFLQNYQGGNDLGPAEWTVENGEFVVGAKQGSIATKQAFGDMQLHVEWMVPVMEESPGQKYGNSGIFIMGLYEIQVLNSYENPTYANGQAGAVYKQHTPLVNASRAPGSWQSYDIFFTAPRFSEDTGKLIQPARVTIIHNGVLVQYNTVIEGPTVFIGKSYYAKHPAKLPIVLQDHNDPVRYRNIWVREL